MLMSQAEIREYWQLVHQLSLRGWYRVRREGEGVPSDAGWGFQEGHTTDTADPRTVNERYIAAPSETAAMRRLLSELSGGLGAARSGTHARETNMQYQDHDRRSFVTSIVWDAPSSASSR